MYLELIADFDKFLAASGRVGQIDFHFSHDPSKGAQGYQYILLETMF
jgi:hypothetical protein